MTIGNTTNENSHVASGVGPYNFSFKAQNIAQVGVYLQDGEDIPVLQDAGTYTVTLNASSPGGSITFNTAPTGGVNVIIHRTPDYLQNTAIPLGALDERALETAFDKLTIQDQELLQRSNRSIQYPVGEDSDTTNTLPVAEARAGKIAIFDDSGNIAVSEDDYVDISAQSAAAVAAAAAAAASASAAAAQAAATITIPSNSLISTAGTNTPRTLAVRLGDNLCALDFGAVADGVTDNAAAFTAYIAYLKARGGGVFRAGNPLNGRIFKCNSSLLVDYSNFDIDFDGCTIDFSGIPHIPSTAGFLIRGQDTGVTTTATVAIAKNAVTISVASTTGFSAGQHILISSTEYFSGIAGVGGFEISSKQEIARITSVGSGVLNLMWGTDDSYAVSGQTVTIRAYNFIENISVDNIKVIGGGVKDVSLENGSGQSAFAFQNVSNVTTGSNVYIQGFQDTAYRFTRYVNVRQNGGYVKGIDNRTSLNWFYGMLYGTGRNFVVNGVNGFGLRRLCDTDSAGIARHGLFSNNAVTYSAFPVGTHVGDRITISGNVSSSCSGGIVVRSKNTVVVGNTIEATTDATSGCLGIGFDVAVSHAAVNMGRQVVANNTFISSGRTLNVSFPCDSIVIRNNNFYFENPQASADAQILLRARTLRDINISDNYFNGTGGTASRAAVYFGSTAQNPIEDLSDVVLANNKVENFFDGFVLENTITPSTPTDNILTTGNKFDAVTGSGVKYVRNVSVGGIYMGDNIITDANYYPAGITARVTLPFGYNMRSMPINERDGQTRMGVAVGDNFKSGQILWRGDTVLNDGQTALIGNTIYNAAPSAGGYIGWICLSQGTAGTLAGYTADAVSGSNQITLNSAPGTTIGIGQWLTVGTVMVRRRVIAISGNVLTMSANATGNATAAAVSWANPVWKGFGLIEV